MICEPTYDGLFRDDLEIIPSTKSRTRPPAPACPADPAARGLQLLADHFDLIERKLRALGRRSGLPAHEADDLVSWALVKLVENDYRILARWEGRSSFSTFLTVVLVNLTRDYRIHVWGKWRPSATARRLGREAELLERMLSRDGLSLDAAVEQLQTAHGVSLSRRELEEIAAALPRRVERRRVGEEELHQLPVDGQVEERVEQEERAEIVARLRKVLHPVLRDLGAEQRLLLKLHYRDGLTMATISRRLGQPQRELYRVRDRCLKRLRLALEGAGLAACEVISLLGSIGELQPDEIWI